MVKKKCKFNKEEALLKDMIGYFYLTIVEIGYVPDTRYDDKYMVSSNKDFSARL